MILSILLFIVFIPVGQILPLLNQETYLILLKQLTVVDVVEYKMIHHHQWSFIAGMKFEILQHEILLLESEFGSGPVSRIRFKIL
jgi:hypothetical protein